MMFFQKKYALFFIFAILTFILFFSKTSLAQDPIPVYCSITDCEETKTEQCGTKRYTYCETCWKTCYNEETGDPYSCDPYPCCPCCYRYSCSFSLNQFKATHEDCKANVEKRQCRSVCTSWNCCDAYCSGCKIECGIWKGSEWIADGTETCEECESWQKAVTDSCEEPNSTEWCSEQPKCKCCGCPDDNDDCAPEESCVEAPTNLEIYQSPISSLRIDPINDIRLPVKLDWDDVPGWGGGWQAAAKNWEPYRTCWDDNRQRCWDWADQTYPELHGCCGWLNKYVVECLKEECDQYIPGEEPECKDTCPAIEEELEEDEESKCYGDLVKSYKIEIRGDLNNCYDNHEKDGHDGNYGVKYTAVLTDSSEFLPPCPCFFKSGRSYSWKVRACCSKDGNNCGPWSEEMSFQTNLAPEPILPPDPDWIDSGRAEPYWDGTDPFPVVLSWCEVEGAVSYAIQAYKDGVVYTPPVLGPSDPKDRIVLTLPLLETKQGYHVIYFDLGSFTKETDYDWEIETCYDESAENCRGPGQLWSFYGFTELAKVKLDSPKDEGCANFYSRLSWFNVAGALSYRYTINEIPALQNQLATSSIPLRDIWDNLQLNTSYTWQVKACWVENGNECEDESLSDTWQFTITGATPTGLDVTEKDPDDGRAVIPIKLKWDDVPCAASYKYELTGGSITIDGITPSSNLIIKYDPAIQHPQQNTEYSFRVWACAKSGGEECGGEASLTFTTFGLKAPQNPHPPDGGKFFTHEYYISWSSVLGGAFYQYEVTNDSTGETIGPDIIGSSNTFIDTSKMEIGTYTWWVKACLDKDCDHYGPASTWTFELVEGGVPGGLVPCGRYANNPDTPWNEREACGIKHFFIMIYLIISYVLWKLIPIVLVLLTIASAIIFYFSGQLGIPEPTAQVKSLWKAVGLGLLVVFLAWIIVSVILGIFGYKVGIFGLWWILDF